MVGSAIFCERGMKHMQPAWFCSAREANVPASQAPRPSVAPLGTLVSKASFLLILLCVQAGCSEPKREGVTVTLLDTGPLPTKGFYTWRDKALVQFTKKTGIAVRALPAYLESTTNQMEFSRKLLQADGVDTPDVYSIDVIW